VYSVILNSLYFSENKKKQEKQHESSQAQVWYSRAATTPGELIHADVCVPFKVPSAKGYRYFVLLKNDFTRYRYIVFLKNKSEVASKLKQILAEMNTIKHTVKKYLSDNGSEFNNDAVRQILSRYGI